MATATARKAARREASLASVRKEPSAPISVPGNQGPRIVRAVTKTDGGIKVVLDPFR